MPKRKKKHEWQKMTEIHREDTHEEWIGDEEEEPTQTEWESMDEEYNVAKQEEVDDGDV